MDLQSVSNTAIASLRDSLDQSKFTAGEWAVVERCVNRLADLGVSASSVSAAELSALSARAQIDLATLANYAVAKEIELVNQVRNVVGVALNSAVSIGLKAIAAIVVA